MSEAAQDFIHELLRRFHQRVDKADTGIRDLRNETSSLRLLIRAGQSDITNIYTMMHQLDERIENRLELRELAEAQARFEPHP